MMGTSRSCEAASLRIRAMAPPCHACGPWEKLNLATDIPPRGRAERIFLSARAGPMVHTIFVAGGPDVPSVPRIPLLRVPPGGPRGAPPEVITLLQRGLSGGGLVFPVPVCISKNALHRESAPEWRNWQTRGTQNPVAARPRGFDPLLRHQANHEGQPTGWPFSLSLVLKRGSNGRGAPTRRRKSGAL